MSAPPTRTRADYLALLGPLAVWNGFVFLHGIYVWLRANADNFVAPTGGRGIEEALFGGVPTVIFQDHLYGDGSLPLDIAGFLVHASWFPIAYIFGVVLMFRCSRRLMEFLWWMLAVSFTGCFIHYLVPMTPPWMEPDVVRVMEEIPMWRGFTYFGADANPVAAFPSLHAALPVAAGLFFILRVPSLRWLGWVSLVHGLATGWFLVYLGEHWVFDIVGGYVLAGLVAVAFASGAVFWVLNRLGVGRKMGALNAAIFPSRVKVVPFAPPDDIRKAA